MIRLMVLCFLIGHISGRDVEYFIQAEEIDWDYAPYGRDVIHGDQTNARLYLERKVYRKVVYREYTDSTFTEKARRADHLGIIGPTLMATYGDFLIVHFRNLATNPHSVHPTRLSYTQENEGSQYWPMPDGADDAVHTGQTFTYRWNVTTLGIPRPDVTCVSGLYYSDTNRVRDVNSGLIGFLIVCRPGNDNEPETKKMNLLFQSFNENLSWYTDSSDQEQENNIMHTVNGYVFGNLPSEHVCTGDNVNMHFGSLGDASEPHTVRIHGHNFIYMGKRQPSLPIISGLTVDAKFLAIETGRWLMTSQNSKLMKAGMQAMVVVEDCETPPLDHGSNGVIRKYYISIDNTVINGRSGTFVGFVPYVDSRFTTRVQRTREEDYLGVLGPIIEAEVGDTIKIVVKNNDTRPHSLQPHGGVRVHKYNEGAFYNDSIVTSPIPPGHYKTYYWTVSDWTGPTAHNSPCMPSYYTSGVEVINEIHTGLIGPMLICQSGLLDRMIPGAPGDLFLFYIRSNTEGSDIIHGLNGFPASSFPRIEMPKGHTALLHAMNVGSDDMASSIFADGIPFSLGGANVFTLGLYHGLMRSFQLNGRKEGQWTISNTAGSEFSFDFRVGSGLEERDPLTINVNETFYIAIQRQDFDYTDRWIGEDDWRSLQEGTYRTGPKFTKAMFICYKSDFFWYCTRKSMGQRPTIRTVAGTKIKIVFQNNSTRNFSMYSPGVVIRRADGGTRLVVHPWEQVEFIWTIPESIGPGSGDQDCVLRRYYSNVDPERDLATGLIGPLIICRNHKSATNDEAVNVPLLVGVVNEAKSWYIDHNIPSDQTSVDRTDPSFTNNNKITVVDYRTASSVAIRNGIINQNTGFYIHNVGDVFHSIHFHGCIITSGSDTELIGQNVVPLFPAETKHVILKCRGIGSWKFEGLRYQDTLPNHELTGLMDMNPEPTSGLS